MKKVIKAQLYISKMDITTFDKKCEDLNKLCDDYIYDIGYNAGLGEYNNKEVMLFECVIVNRTASGVNQDYKTFKELIKEVMGKQPKQIFMLKLDKMF